MLGKLNKISGLIADLVNERFIAGTLIIENKKISAILPDDSITGPYILPGFVDAHMHPESTMLSPGQFAREAVRQGTIAVLADPHEIANVLGVEGIDYLIDLAKVSGFNFFFGAPSCVPASDYESSGAILAAAEIEKLMQRNDIWFLAEMMNFPGVINQNIDILTKIKSALINHKPVDGHAPGLIGDELVKYVEAGISSDHECSDMAEALAKIQLGQLIQIREGSAAKNYTVLAPLLQNNPDKIAFCTDDLHPQDLINGHINAIVKQALADGYDFFKVIKAASFNTVNHYKIPVGLLRVGDSADFVVTDDLKTLNLLSVYINGSEVFDGKNVDLPKITAKLINNWHCQPLNLIDLQVSAAGKSVHAIEVSDGSLLTKSILAEPLIINGLAEGNCDEDLIKIVVVNRYQKDARPAVAFVKNFGLKRGALAQSIAHDSHNLIAVGVADADLLEALNQVIAQKGGICFVDGNKKITLELEIAGLQTDRSAQEVAEIYEQIENCVKNNGCNLTSPSMTLSFLSLSVIPEIKLTAEGLVENFQRVDLWV